MPRRTIKDTRVLYNQVFQNEGGKEVLADLRKFCFATATTFDDNPYEMARREGRREVFMQITNLMKVKYEDFYDYETDDFGI